MQTKNERAPENGVKTSPFLSVAWQQRRVAKKNKVKNNEAAAQKRKEARKLAN